jgi:hypothetical protein
MNLPRVTLGYLAGAQERSALFATMLMIARWQPEWIKLNGNYLYTTIERLRCSNTPPLDEPN